MVLKHGAAPSYLCYANDVTGVEPVMREASLTFLGQAGRKAAAFSSVRGIFRFCAPGLLVRLLGLGQHFGFMRCLCFWGFCAVISSLAMLG